jgi:hypothetical protein
VQSRKVADGKSLIHSPFSGCGIHSFMMINKSHWCENFFSLSLRIISFTLSSVSKVKDKWMCKPKWLISIFRMNRILAASDLDYVSFFVIIPRVPSIHYDNRMTMVIRTIVFHWFRNNKKKCFTKRFSIGW